MKRGWQKKQGEDVSLLPDLPEAVALHGHHQWKVRWKTTVKRLEDYLTTDTASLLSSPSQQKSRWHMVPIRISY